MAGGKTLEQVIAIAGKLDPSLKASLATAEKLVNGTGAKLKKAGAVTAKAVGVASAATTAAATAAATAVAAITKSAMDNYASYEQLTGGVETLFGKSADTVIKNAQGAYETAGMDANTYMDTVTSFSASLLQSLGGDTKKAASYADMAIVDMSDNANKMGSDITSIQTAYQGFAKQNYTMLDNLKLGYGGTKSEMERLLDDAKKLKAQNGETVDYSIEKYSDIVDAIHVVQDNMGITGTTAKEASTTIEGSVNSAKAAYSNWLTSLASEDYDVGETTEALVRSIITAAKNIVPRIAQILKTMGETLPQYLPGLFDTLGAEFGTLLQDALAVCFGDGGAELGASLSELFSGILPLAMDFVNSMMPIVSQLLSFIGDGAKTLAPMIMSCLSQIMPLLSNLIGALLPPILDLLNQLMPIVMDIISAILPVVTELLIAMSPVISMIASVISSVLSALMPLIQPIMQLIQVLLPPVTSLIMAILSALQPVISVIGAIASGVGTLVGWLSQLVDFATKAADALGDIGGTIGGAIGGLFGFATGGFTDGLAIAGEDPRYPTEAVISFNPAYRAQNVKYWKIAGAMLGASGGSTEPVYGFATGGFTGDVGAALSDPTYNISGNAPVDSTTYDLSGLTFAPKIEIYGNADEGSILEALRAVQPEFTDWITEILDAREEAVYV